MNGVWSCHLTLGWIFQVVSMVPSGLMRQVPRSTEIISAASCGCQDWRSSSTGR